MVKIKFGEDQKVSKYYVHDCSGTKNENVSNKELAGELHKPIIRKFKKRKVH